MSLSKHNKKLLVVDVGNTSATVGGYDGESLLFQSRFAKNELDPIADCWKRNDMPDAIVIASVNPNVSSRVYKILQIAFESEPLLIGKDIPIKIPVRYDKPEEVGDDRLLNALAAFDRLKTSAIVVDFGTAVTFDVVSEEGEYMGGVIAPGIQISADALHEKTAFLPRIDIAKPTSVVGKSTVAAMQAGLYWGFIGMVERILSELEVEIGRNATVIATGGDAKLVTREIGSISKIVPELTLEGIRLAFYQA